MAELSDLFAKRMKLEIKSRDVSWHIVYDPSRWTVHWQVRSATEDLNYDEVVATLAQCLLEWDLTRDGKALPVNEETLWSLPKEAIEHMHGRIFLAESGQIPGEEIEGKAKPSRRPRGTRRKKQPTGSE